jgi:hypothetical protein
MNDKSDLMLRIEAALELVKNLRLEEIKNLQVKRFGFQYQTCLEDYLIHGYGEDYLNHERRYMKEKLSRGLVENIDNEFGLPISVTTTEYIETHRADLYVLVPKEKSNVIQKES